MSELAVEGETDDLDARLAGAPLPHTRETFLKDVLIDLAATLENVAGVDEASGLVALVGAHMGALMNDEYRKAARVSRLSIDDVAAALVDLKGRLKAGFKIDEISETRIVLVNSACPFGRDVLGRSSLCMMTSSVFGRIAADNLGYARIGLEETIAPRRWTLQDRH